jgi:hypothetical protein
MNNKGKLVIFVLGLISILLIAAFTIAPTTQAGPDNRSDKLHGSWNVVVTTEIQGATFPALLTFTSDGSLIADEPPSPFETSGHGNWVSTGPGQVAYTFVTLVGSAEGPLSAKYKVVGTLNLGSDKESWSGPFKIDILDPNGQVIFADRGTFSLTRIAIEPLP